MCLMVRESIQYADFVANDKAKAIGKMSEETKQLPTLIQLLSRRSHEFQIINQ